MDVILPRTRYMCAYLNASNDNESSRDAVKPVDSSSSLLCNNDHSVTSLTASGRSNARPTSMFDSK